MTDKTFQKYKLVIDEWFANGQNGVQAYMKFYPNAKYEAADKSFRRMTENDRIQEYVKQKQKEIAERSEIPVEMILGWLKDALNADPLDFVSIESKTAFTRSGDEFTYKSLEINDLKKLPKKVRLLIKSIEPSRDGIKIKFYDKTRVVEILNKMLGYNHESEKPKGDTVNYTIMSNEEIDARFERIKKMKELERRKGND